MREIAQHPAQRVAQLAIGLDGGFEDFRADAQIVGIIGGAHPHAQNVGAGMLDHVLRRGDVAERLRHLVAALVEHEAVGEHDVERRAAAGAAAFQQRRLKPAAMLVGAFEIHHRLGPAVGLALDMGERRKNFRVFEHESMRRAGIEPDVEDIVDLPPVLVGARAEEALARALRIPGVGAFLLERLGDARIHRFVVEDFGGAIALLAHEHRDRHAPGALARDHPVGPALDHAVDAVLARRRHPARDFDGFERAMAQRVAFSRDVLVHRDEPLRRVAEDDRLFRAPGMRILMLEPAARDQHAVVGQEL